MFVRGNGSQGPSDVDVVACRGTAAGRRPEVSKSALRSEKVLALELDVNKLLAATANQLSITFSHSRRPGWPSGIRTQSAVNGLVRRGRRLACITRRVEPHAQQQRPRLATPPPVIEDEKWLRASFQEPRYAFAKVVAYLSVQIQYMFS